MEEERSLAELPHQEKEWNIFSSNAPVEGRIEEASNGTDPSSTSKYDARDLISNDSYSRNETETRSRPMKFRQLYQEVDPEYYEKEADFMKIKPEDDHREVVSDTTVYPYSAQGRLMMIFSGKAVYGSGTLIGSKYVLTAAQNLYPKYFNKEPDSILFIPALKGSRLPYGLIGVRRYFYPEEYKDTRLEDYALLELEDDIGEVTGFLEMRSHKADEIDGKECSLYGYPGNVNEEENNYLYGMSGIVSYIESKGELKYNIEAGAGVGGASIYYKSPEDGKYYTIGVHVKGYTREGHNSGVYLTPERIERIREWMAPSIKPTKHNLQTLTSEVYGRENELNILREYMRNQTRFGVVAISGIPGTGKDTIALKYAIKCIGSYDYIWRINAETECSFRADVLGLAETLRIEGRTYQEALIKLKWVMNSRDMKFLIIIDNLQDEIIVKELLHTRGHYIITTRLEVTQFQNIKLNTLSREASIQLLSSILSDQALEDLETLARFLEDLPLALVQAAAYIRENRLKISEYIDSFSSLLDIDSRLKNIISQNINSFCEESKHILSIVCLGHNDNIPYDMLYKVFRYKYPDTEEFDFNYYLVETLKFNILSYDTKKYLLKIHRVIQEASIHQLSPHISDELIQHYYDYLYNNYNPQADIYLKEDICQLKYLTLHASTFLNKYKTHHLSSRELLLSSKLATVYLLFLNDHATAANYIKMIEEALRDYKEEDSDLDTVYNNLGKLYHSTGEYERSEHFYLKNLRIQEAVSPSNHPDLATSYNNLAALYESMGDYKKAEEYFIKCLEIREGCLSNDHPDLAKIYLNLGSLYKSIGRNTNSEEYLKRCLNIRESILPANHPDLAETYNSLGILCNSIGKNKEAEECYLRCLRIREAMLPSTHPDLANIYNNLGLYYISMGDFTQSEEYYLRCLEIWKSTLAENHPDLATVYNNLGILYYNMGDIAKSEEHLFKCLKIREAILPNHSQVLAATYNNIGKLYFTQEDYKTSEEYYLKSLQTQESVLHENHPDRAAVYINLGELYEIIGDFTKSENYHLKSLQTLETVLPSNHPNLAAVYSNLGSLYLSMGDYKRAEDYYMRCIKIRETILPTNHPDLASIYSNLGVLYYFKGEYSISEEYYLKCLTIFEAVLPQNHRDLATTYNNIGGLYENRGEYKRSEGYYSKGVRILETILPQNHPDLASVYSILGKLHDSMGDYAKGLEYKFKIQTTPFK